MAIKPKQILETAVDAGKSAVGAAERRLRGRKSGGPSGAPSTVGASEPGTSRGPKSSTASTRPKKAKAKPRKPAKRRATASRAAASSGKQVKDAAKKG